MAKKKPDADRPKNPPLLPLEDDFTIKKIRLDAVRADGGTQMRVDEQPDVVQDYAEKYERDVELPPPVVFFDGTDYWLADGFQRVRGAGMAKLSTLRFRVYQGTQRQAILYAVGANEEHGLKRTPKDRRQAVETLLNDVEWNQSDRWVARMARVSHGFVGKIRAEIEEAARLVCVGAGSAVSADPKPERPLDIPADFRPDPQHSPPDFSEESEHEDSFLLDSSPVETAPADCDEPQLYDEPDAESGSEPEPGQEQPAGAEPEFRIGIDGKKRPVKKKPKAKPKPEPLPDVNPLAKDDPTPEVEAGLTAIGEPVTELTAPMFAAVRDMNVWGREIDRLSREAARLSDMACHATFSYIQMMLANAKAGLLDYRPYALCPDCEGHGCSPCKFGGHITKKQYVARMKQQGQDDAADQAA